MADDAQSTRARVFRGIAALLVVMAALPFVPAWSLTYWAGWAFLVSFEIGSVVLTAYLARHDPALLERRMRSGPGAEREPAQKLIQAVNGAGFFGLLIVPGLDHHLGWSHVPMSLIIGGQILVVLCFAAWLIVFRENTFAASIVEVAPNQRVVHSGPYAIVRHPMYSAGLAVFVGTTLALGSYWGLVVALILLGGLVARLLHEERFLERELRGYSAYRRTVRWRLVPGVW